jgi:hypothetical protein
MRRSKALKGKTLTALTLASLLILLAVSPLIAATSPGSALNPEIWPVDCADAAAAYKVVNVRKEEVDLSSRASQFFDAGRQGTAYPEALDHIKFLRYSVDGAAKTFQSADAVIIALSGLHAGNNGFDKFAKEAVAKAWAYRQINIEVWAVDRRVNNLEDLTGLNYLEELAKTGQLTNVSQAGEILNGYYYHTPSNSPYITINGKTFQGFYTGKTAPWLSEFGLRMAMEDVRVVIQNYFPNQADSKKKVYIAGDSLGATVAADFASWDFDGNASTTADAGYSYIAGVMALDALMTPNAVPVMQDVLSTFTNFLPSPLKNLLNTSSLSTYASTLTAIRNGSLDVLLPTSELGYVPTTYFGVEVTSMLADSAPDMESTFYQSQAPIAGQIDPRSDMILRIAMSKNLSDFLSGVVFQKRVRWTNEALLGIALDNNFNPITMNEATMGFLSSADGTAQVEEKSFPSIGGLENTLPLSLWDPISGFMPYAKMYIPKDPEARKTPLTGPLYTWVNYNEIDNQTPAAAFARKYTNSSSEVSDLHDVAKCFYDGTSNTAEWYYTTRLFADIMVAPTSGSSKYGLNVLHADQLPKVPTTIWMNEHGTNIGYARMNHVTPTAVLPGTHLDVMMMSMSKDPKTSDAGKSLMMLPMCDWIIKTSNIVNPPPPPPPAPGCGQGAGASLSAFAGLLGLISVAGLGFRRRRAAKTVSTTRRSHRS